MGRRNSDRLWVATDVEQAGDAILVMLLTLLLSIGLTIFSI